MKASPTFSRCTVMSNKATIGGGIFIASGNMTLANCIFTGNTARSGAAIHILRGNLTILNSTLTGNRAEFTCGGIFTGVAALNMSGCILWNNTAQADAQMRSTAAPVYSCIQDWIGGLGNIACDPCFVDPGHWDVNGTPDDPNDDFWVQGDYHLKSQGWRWDSQQNLWTWDTVTSRCIDAGNPGSLLAEEPITLDVDPLNRVGKNIRLDMGAYAAAEQASMPPYGWALLADLNNDGDVNFIDLACWIQTFLSQDADQPGDLNRDGTVNLADFALFMADWQSNTIWKDR